jgi:Cu/Ag efflux pump CusA
MTSFSVMAGNLPLALALEPGSSSRASLGIVVIGGVLSSLILTMLLVPNAYVWMAPKNVTPKPSGEPEATPPPHFEPERRPTPAGVS